MALGACFRCGQDARLAYFYDNSVGHFAIGGEPRVCEECNQKLVEMSEEARREVFAGFEATPDPPSDHEDLFAGFQARSDEFGRRGRS